MLFLHFKFKNGEEISQSHQLILINRQSDVFGNICELSSAEQHWLATTQLNESVWELRRVNLVHSCNAFITYLELPAPKVTTWKQQRAMTVQKRCVITPLTLPEKRQKEIRKETQCRMNISTTNTRTKRLCDKFAGISVSCHKSICLTVWGRLS